MESASDLVLDEQTTFKVIRQMADPVEGSQGICLVLTDADTPPTMRVTGTRAGNGNTPNRRRESCTSAKMLEAATLPIRGQEEKSAFGAHRSIM